MKKSLTRTLLAVSIYFYGQSRELLGGNRSNEKVNPNKQPPEDIKMDEEASSIQELPDLPPIRAASHDRFLTVATLFQNERPRLREWIEFNIMMGVDHFILYDHKSTDMPIDILQYYINQGVITYIPWPPTTVPPPDPFKTRSEAEQYSRFQSNLEECISDQTSLHRQAPCQQSAFIDAIRRTKGGVSRWLGVIDVDEFIFPRRKSNFTSIKDILEIRHNDTDQVRVTGSHFGPGDNIEHPPLRESGSLLQPLITESYIHRPELYTVPPVDGWAIEITKCFANPDMIAYSEIHNFVPLGSPPTWKQDEAWVEDIVWKFNHYSILSVADVSRKAEKNKNPFLEGFTEELREYYNRVLDTEILHYVPELKRRMLCVLQEHPPSHPDDWTP